MVGMGEARVRQSKGLPPAVPVVRVKMPAGNVQAMSGVEALAYLTKTMANLDDARAETVAVLRDRGVGWAAIGQAAGVTDDAARKRWGQ